MRANVDKRKQTLTPPFIAVFYTPLCNPLKIVGGQDVGSLRVKDQTLKKARALLFPEEFFLLGRSPRASNFHRKRKLQGL